MLGDCFEIVGILMMVWILGFLWLFFIVWWLLWWCCVCWEIWIEIDFLFFGLGNGWILLLSKIDNFKILKVDELLE